MDGETVETVTDFILGGSKITADGNCSHEIKRHFLLGRKAMTKLDSILKSRDITLPTMAHLVKAIVCPIAMLRCESWTLKKAETKELMLLNCGVFPVVMYGCECWTMKKAEHRRIDAFEL